MSSSDVVSVLVGLAFAVVVSVIAIYITVYNLGVAVCVA